MKITIGTYEYNITDSFGKVYEETLGNDFQSGAIMYATNELDSENCTDVCKKYSKQEVYDTIIRCAKEELAFCGVVISDA